MNKKTYLAKKRALAAAPPARRMRELCGHCLQPVRTCYCAVVRAFDPGIKFVILIHRLEVRRRIATGRLSHLILQNSDLIMGYDYSHNPKLNAILENPVYHPVVLYPGRNSVNFSRLSTGERSSLFPEGKTPAIIVIDGTWSTAKKMLRRSANLRGLPQICFTPEKPSNFRVRKQPHRECVSTVEAIHHTIELLGPSRGFDLACGAHDNLLQVFDRLVEQQLEYVKRSLSEGRPTRHRRNQFAELS